MDTSQSTVERTPNRVYGCPLIRPRCPRLRAGLRISCCSSSSQTRKWLVIPRPTEQSFRKAVDLIAPPLRSVRADRCSPRIVDIAHLRSAGPARVIGTCVDAPVDASSFWSARCMRSGAVVCPASLCGR